MYLRRSRASTRRPAYPRQKPATSAKARGSFLRRATVGFSTPPDAAIGRPGKTSERGYTRLPGHRTPAFVPAPRRSDDGCRKISILSVLNLPKIKVAFRAGRKEALARRLEPMEPMLSPKKSVATLPFDDWPPNYESQFWELYPRRVSKKTAMKALAKVKASGEVPWQKIVDAIERYKAWLAQTGPNVWRPEAKHPATWLNGGCWDDELPDPEPTKPSFFQQVYGNADRRDH